jgi:hypothetical protein
MKTQACIASLLLALSGAAFAAGKHGHGHEHKPAHGGVVTEAGGMDFELVAKADSVTLHVRGHDGKPASVAGATGKLTILSGTEKTEAALAPEGNDKLQAKGSFKVGAGTKFVATVHMAGKKPINMRFALK